MLSSHIYQGRKRNPNPNFGVRISSGGVGVFHVKGWGPRSSVCPFEAQGNQTFWRDIPGLCRDIPRVPEKFEKKSLAPNLRYADFTHKLRHPYPSTGVQKTPSLSMKAQRTKSVNHTVSTLAGGCLLGTSKHWGHHLRVFCPQQGRTPKGSYSPSGAFWAPSGNPFSEPLLRTLLRTLLYCKTHKYRRSSQNPSENPSPEPFPEPSQNPS